LTLKKLVLVDDKFWRTKTKTRMRSSMLNPKAHQRAPVRVAGTAALE